MYTTLAKNRYQLCAMLDTKVQLTLDSKQVTLDNLYYSSVFTTICGDIYELMVIADMTNE